VVDPYGNTRLGVEGSVTINRMDYGVAWSKTLDAGGLVVGNDVKIDLEVEAIKEKGN
jgi:polyisoprenoid-binding protein YceI